MFAFILFAILGWCVFAPPAGQTRTVIMIVFTIMLVLWLLVGLGAFSMPYAGSRW